jgi:hypothetical protein
LAALLAFAAAVLAPLYLRASEDSVVRSTMTQASVPAAGANLGPGPGIQLTLSQMQAAEAAVIDMGGPHHWFGDPITSVVAGLGISGPTTYTSSFYFRTGLCAHLTMVTGSCRLGPNQVIMSQRTANLLGDSSGQQINVVTPGSHSGGIRVTVTGIYAIPNFQATYWWGEGPGIFDFGAGSSHSVDPLFSSSATALAVPSQDSPYISAQIPLFTDRITLANEGTFLHQVGQVTVQIQSQATVLQTGATTLLATAAHERHVMSTIIVTVAVQLLLLALWVLAGLVVRNSEGRQSEIRLARLRGFPLRSVLGVIALEPAVLCLVAAPLGGLVAWLAVRGIGGHLFSPHTSIQPDGWLWASAGAAAAGVGLSLAVGVARVYRATSLNQAQIGVGRRRAAALWRTRSGIFADVVILALSAAALVELSASGAFSSGRSDPLAAAGPGLVALGMGVIGVQLVLLAARAIAALTANSHRVGTFLAVRQVARRPVLLRQARVLVVALCLACFASAAWSVAHDNRARVAGFEVGAPTVATVSVPTGTDPVQLVAKVDPSGRYAMAAAVITTPSSTLLAVDPSRMNQVVSWPKGITGRSEQEVAAALTPVSAPPVYLSGSALAVQADISGAAVAADAGPVDLEGWVYNLAGSSTTFANFGPIEAGLHTYHGSLNVGCLSTCRFDGISLVGTAGTSPQLSTSGVTQVAVNAIGVANQAGQYRPVAADLTGLSWSTTTSGVRISAGQSGPVITISSGAMATTSGGVGVAGAPMAGPANLPATLPAVVTSQEVAVNGGGAPGSTIPAQGLDGGTINVAPTVVASVLPRVGANASMINLEYLELAQTTLTQSDVTFQVWLSRSAPADILSQLDAVGLHVQSVETAAAVAKQLDKSGPALADDFLLLATAAALLVVALSTLAALAATARQRAVELSVLEIAGVRRSSLLRSLAGEVLALGVTALFGMVAALIATAVAVPSLPVLATNSSGQPPLQYPLPVLLIIGVSALVLVAVVVAGVVTNAAIARRSGALLTKARMR